VSHHAVAYDDDFLEAREDFAHFFGREPAHVAAQWDVGAIEAGSAASGEGTQEVIAVFT
jgi:hypothetical protein